MEARLLVREAFGAVTVIRYGRAVLNAVHAFAQAHGFPPTLAEVAQAIGVNTTGPIQHAVYQLRRFGFVAWEPGKARTLRVLKWPAHGKREEVYG